MDRSFSEDLKRRMVYLHIDGYNKWRISEFLYVSYSGVRRVLKKWNRVDNPFKVVRSTDIIIRFCGGFVFAIEIFCVTRG